MKRIIALLLVTLCLLSLAACGTSSGTEVTYGEKYIYKSDVSLPEGEQSYLIFYRNGTFDFHYYYRSSVYEGEVTHCTLTMKYEVLSDGRVACFYDSVELHDDDNQSKAEDFSDDSYIMTLSKNVIVRGEDSFYIRESYLEDGIPNFQ